MDIEFDLFLALNEGGLMGKIGTFASILHLGQYRRGSGASYIVHPLAVVKILRSVGVSDEDVLIAAWLHDSLEDTNISKEELKDKFGERVVGLVSSVTSSMDDIKTLGKTKYLIKKMLDMDKDSLSIKLADRLHNVRDTRSMSGDKVKQLMDQTSEILDGIQGRALTLIHKALIRHIRFEIKIILNRISPKK